MYSHTTPSSTFPCTECGLCCQHVNVAVETQFLDRGDGICRSYDVVTKHCTIYAERPDICRVDRQYLIRYAQKYTWDEYVALNLQACAYLQNQEVQIIPSVTEDEEEGGF